MPQTNPKPEVEEKSLSREDVDLAFSVRIVRRGNHFYLSIHDRDVSFWDLLGGDEVLVKIVKVKRAKRPVYLGDSET